MNDEITSFEKRRAKNLVWNAAGTNEFEPPILIYDEDDKADLYWNSIIGSVYLHFDWNALQSFYESFEHSKYREEKENLFWLALEHAAFLKESKSRMVFPSLRREYVKRTLADMNTEKAALNKDLTWSYRLLRGHLQRILEDDNIGIKREQILLTKEENDILDIIETGEDVSTEELINKLEYIYDKYFLGKSRTSILPSLGSMYADLFSRNKKNSGLGKKKHLSRIMWVSLDSTREMAFGTVEHVFEEEKDNAYLDTGFFKQSKTQEQNFKKYLSNYFGKSMYDEAFMAGLEKELCTDEDTGCHLYYTRGDYAEKMEEGTFVAIHNRSGDNSDKENKAAYNDRQIKYGHIIERLSSRIKNSLLVHLESTSVKSKSGRLVANRIWRGLYLDEKHVFNKELPGDFGNITVDILLDASESQSSRKNTIAAQGYILAESLTKCNIPVRISSFCSMSGHTIMTIYRDYDEPQNNERIFRYFTAGCNRDGLGIRMITNMLRNNTAEHRLLITLSDCKPMDVVRLRESKNNYIDYAREAAVNTTAKNVRRACAEGISVMCIFTGDDVDLPAARTIYDRNFVRIHSLDRMADTVSNLLQSSIRHLDGSIG